MSNLFRFAILYFLLVKSGLATSSQSPSPLNDDVLGLIVFKADLRDPASKLAS
ncbi:inactive leucine-rich repeat receptor-like protein kinase [Acorus calamus]|uniref:Inactive leucine-rich repeat receptor-like protein kinase n=1 Tax=Acorus calamus TaxID=4465 RepID=A0AAV9DY07_ACOCL|nr:inactive leucine-rich repeat receptor-like protein kinase [Acorus calamus]